MDAILDRLASSVTTAKTVEELTRPLLELLETVTGMESTYLTSVDIDAGVQKFLFSRNTGQLEIPEGQTVPWEETLCKRALESGQFFTQDAGLHWGDSGAVRYLGIRTYMSSPVHLSDGALYGTLCASSKDQHALRPEAKRLLTLFASLIAHQIEREQLVAQLVRANERLAAYATTDTLTALPNRRALQDELARQLALGKRQNFSVLVAFIDLDGFKSINDTHGHSAGDEFLVVIAARLKATLRAGDLAARLGGDEFVVVGQGPGEAHLVEEAKRAFQARIFEATVGSIPLEAVEISYAGASVGVLAVEPGQHDPEQVLSSADALMYQTKMARRSAASAF